MNPTNVLPKSIKKAELTAARERIVSKSVRDFGVIAKQIIRFASMTPKALMAHLRRHKEDAFCDIRRPDGRGSLMCGSIGINRFDQIAERVFDFAPSLENRVSHDHARKTVVEVFQIRILEEGRDIDTPTVGLILNDVVKKLLQSMTDTEHYLPCVLFHHGGPNEFSIGPVKFIRRGAFFRDKKKTLQESIKRNIEEHVAFVAMHAEQRGTRDGLATIDQSIKLVRNLQARAIKTYRSYPWVAQVKIVGCDNDVAGELAVKTIDAALHVIRILLGAGLTRRVRLAWSRGDALKTAGMWADDLGVIHVSVGSSSLGPVGAQNWYEGLTQGDGFLLAIFGSAISVLSNPKPIFHLHQRFLDSIHWFGDAATETEATSRIIKYTSGIERLIFGKFERGQRLAFAKRVCAISNAFYEHPDARVYENAIKVYEARSALLHGAWSPRHENAKHLAAIAEDLCHLCIVCVGHLFPLLLRKLGDISPEEWEKLMHEISEDAPNVLARYGISAQHKSKAA